MKYTRSENNEVVEVRGCTTCPHMQRYHEGGADFMRCHAPTLRGDGKYKLTMKKLIGRWEGGYHASCPLASKPESVPVVEVKK